MSRKRMLTIGIAAVWLAVLGGLAISAQDKYTVKVPGGLAFSEFRGYEAWQTISISRNEKVMAVIVGNPAMIQAYQAGIPGNGKPVPDGAKMAKIHWIPKPNDFFPEATVPGNLLNVDFMVKDSKRFADGGGWGYAVFDYDARHDGWHAAARQRRQVRGRVPHDSEGERLRLYRVRQAVKPYATRATRSVTTIPVMASR